MWILIKVKRNDWKKAFGCPKTFFEGTKSQSQSRAKSQNSGIIFGNLLKTNVRKFLNKSYNYEMKVRPPDKLQALNK